MRFYLASINLPLLVRTIASADLLCIRTFPEVALASTGHCQRDAFFIRLPKLHHSWVILRPTMHSELGVLYLEIAIRP